jgi:hypothetical protein
MTAVPTPHLKAGQGIRGLEPETLERAVLHPLQRANVEKIEELIDRLDACASPEDQYELQRHILASVYGIEERRAACSRVAKRLQHKESLPTDTPDLPGGRDPTDPATWQFEILVCERLARQVRCVADGLAWKAYGYDRRFITALARNARSGPLNNKVGLHYELGRVEDLWQKRGHFGLLHDLTNCLRIADISEFLPAGGALLHEVKKARSIPTAQKARAQAAVDAIMIGGVLPGDLPDARIAVLSTKFRADMGPLRDVIHLARSRGSQGINLPEGRMLFAASLWDAARLSNGDLRHGTDKFVSTRAAAIRRAHIDGATHHLVGHSGDTAGRSPVVAPFSIFPLDPADRADLICDLMTFETVLSIDSLAQMLRDRGLRVEVLFPERDQQLPMDADVLRVRYRNRELTIHAPAMSPLGGWCRTGVYGAGVIDSDGREWFNGCSSFCQSCWW